MPRPPISKFRPPAANPGDVPTPAYGKGLVYCDSGRGGLGIAVDRTGSGDVTKSLVKWTTNPVPEGYSSPIIVGDYVYVNQLRVHVLGILEAKGNFMDEDQDKTILMPFNAVLKMYPFMSRFMPFIVEATKEEDTEEASLQISHVLRTRHDLQPGEPNDFRVFRQDEMLRDFERVKMVATSILAGIVGISLIVGGIGIMNVMLVSVTERTREIGLRKSVGGRRRDILAQFLTEAMVLATLGGAIGIAFGYTICAVASLHPSMVTDVKTIGEMRRTLSHSAPTARTSSTSISTRPNIRPCIPDGTHGTTNIMLVPNPRSMFVM